MFLWIDDYSGILFMNGAKYKIMAGIVIEIDWIIRDLNTRFQAELPWLENAYERALKVVKKTGNDELVLPQVYSGLKKNVATHISPLPNSKAKSVLFYTVGEENYGNFRMNTENYLTWDLGIVFWVNLEKIDPAALVDENYTQTLIRDARRVITSGLLGSGYSVVIKSITRDVEEVYREFDLPDFKSKRYLYEPFGGFRFDCSITMREDCDLTIIDRCSSLLANISYGEKNDCILPTYNFSDDTVFNSLTAQQITDLNAQLGGGITMTREEFTVTGATQSIFITTNAGLAYSHTVVTLNGDQLASDEFTIGGVGDLTVTLITEATQDDVLIVLNVI